MPLIKQRREVDLLCGTNESQKIWNSDERLEILSEYFLIIKAPRSRHLHTYDKKSLFIPSPLILSKPPANIIDPSSVVCFLGLAVSTPILLFINLISHFSYDDLISLLPKYDPIPLFSCKDAVLLFFPNNPVPRLLFSGRPSAPGYYGGSINTISIVSNSGGWKWSSSDASREGT